MKTTMEIAPIFDSANGEVKISGRQLHMFLEVQTRYNDWFTRMKEYGFTEGVDFNLLKNEQVQTEGTREVRREVIDHLMNLSMAKELAMLQRTERGKEARLYFIMPTQKSMDMELFTIKETAVTHADGHTTISKTPKVTGKGQVYFVNKFVNTAIAVGV